MVHGIRFVLLLALAVFSMGASAQVYQLTFEGLQPGELVQNFYNGGTGSLGSSGPNYGVSFSDTALAGVDSDVGGNANMANEPSPDTVVFWMSGGSVVMNVPAGFSTGFSFYYSSATAATVTVYDGPDATGNVLATINLAAQHDGNGCTGDPTGTFCNWTQAGASFSGTARSVDFSGTENQTGYDNITIGSATPVLAVPPRPVPTLSEWGMILLSVVLMLGFYWQRRRSA